MSLATKCIRFLYPIGSTRTVLRGPIRGSKFNVVSGMGLTYALGQDHWNFSFFVPRIEEQMTVYDIGANCGQMALFFSRQVGPTGRVVSFEPVPSNVATLRQNLALNNCQNVTVIEAAVAADSEPRTFCFDEAHHTMGTIQGSMVKLDQWDTTFEVQCVTLDGLLESGKIPPPQVMKIDVEGAGMEVIQGALNLIREHRPGIYFELHAADQEAPELKALHLLRDEFGYEIRDLNGTLQDHLGPQWGAAVWCEPKRG